MLTITCTAEDLAHATADPDYTGGTYAVNITPSAPGCVTFRPHTFVHSARFAVGGAAHEGSRVFPRDGCDVGAITRAILAVSSHALVVGLWRDDRGRLWIDAVDMYDRLTRAMLVARARGELAVWDGIASVEIAV